MKSLDDVYASLPPDLSDDDILIDCASTTIDIIDAAQLLEELLIRRRAKTFTLLGPDDELAEETRRVAAILTLSDRIKFVT